MTLPETRQSALFIYAGGEPKLHGLCRNLSQSAKRARDTRAPT